MAEPAPAHILGPIDPHDVVIEIAKRHGLKAVVWDEDDLIERGPKAIATNAPLSELMHMIAAQTGAIDTTAAMLDAKLTEIKAELETTHQETLELADWLRLNIATMKPSRS